MKTLFLCFAFIALSGCATLSAEEMNKVCTTHAGYEEGYNDAKNNEPMDSSYYTQCPTNRDLVHSSYKEGFEKGRAEVIAEKEAASRKPYPVIEESPKDPNKLVLCKINVFGKEYRFWGKNEIDARSGVIKSCVRRHGEPFCRDTVCVYNPEVN